MEELIGAIDAVEAGPTVEEECHLQKASFTYGDQFSGLPLGSEVDGRCCQGRVEHHVGVASQPGSAGKLSERTWAERHRHKMDLHKK